MVYTRCGVMSILVSKGAKTPGVNLIPTSEEPGVAKIFMILRD